MREVPEKKPASLRSDRLPEVVVPSTFDVFYRAEYGRVLALMVGLVGRTAAEDIAQEAFLRAYRDWEQVKGADSPVAWVRKVALNLSRSRWRRLSSEAAAITRLAFQSSVRTVDLPSESSEEFWQEVRKLPRRQAEVVALRYICDLALSDIAETLGVREGTVKASLHQARERLRRQLEAKGMS